MCDYSLESYRTRPAAEGERYRTTRFASGMIGLAAPGDSTTAICCAEDTRLRLEGIPRSLQERHGVGPVEEVRFVRLDRGFARDGIEFANGARVPLSFLGEGVTVTIAQSLGAQAGRSATEPAL